MKGVRFSDQGIQEGCIAFVCAIGYMLVIETNILLAKTFNDQENNVELLKGEAVLRQVNGRIDILQFFRIIVMYLLKVYRFQGFHNGKRSIEYNVHLLWRFDIISGVAQCDWPRAVCPIAPYTSYKEKSHHKHHHKLKEIKLPARPSGLLYDEAVVQLDQYKNKGDK